MIEKITDKLGSLDIKKISPFAGGLSNNAKKIDSTNYIKIEDLFKNKDTIKIIVNYLNGHKSDNPIKGIVLRGPIGSGKMTLLNACIKHCNYSVHLYDTDYESDDIYDNLILSITAKGISKLFIKENRVILIRDVDNSLKTAQKKSLFKFLNESKNTLPILMTSSDISIGTTREVPKSILQLDLENPYLNDFIRIGNKIAKEESLNISNNAIEKIAKESNFDIRFFINTLKGIKPTPKKVSIKTLPDFIKDNELDTFKRIKYCSEPTNDFEIRERYADMYTNSTIFHNYPKIIDKSKLSESEKLKKMYLMSEMVCSAEEVRNYACNNQIWDVLDGCYGILGTIMPLAVTEPITDTDYFTYPPNYISNWSRFDKIDQNSYIMNNIIKPTYFPKNKFDPANLESLKQDLKDIEDPIKSYKVGSILESTKDTNAFLNKFKKELVKTNHKSTRPTD